MFINSLFLVENNNKLTSKNRLLNYNYKFILYFHPVYN